MSRLDVALDGGPFDGASGFLVWDQATPETLWIRRGGTGANGLLVNPTSRNGGVPYVRAQEREGRMIYEYSGAPSGLPFNWDVEALSPDEYVVAVKDRSAEGNVWNIESRHPTAAAAAVHLDSLNLPIGDTHIETVELFRQHAARNWL